MKIAVFFHARISGGLMPMNADGQQNVSVNPEVGRHQFIEQMKLMVDSGLYDAASEIYVGLNGGDDDVVFCRDHLPVGCILIPHGEGAKSLLPTMRYLQEWFPGHEDWAVYFWHMKGVTHPGDPMRQAWRACMEKHIIKDWHNCVGLLSKGDVDSVGCHWLHGTDEGRPVDFWGGVFWWTTAKFLLTLPPLIPECKTRAQWYASEHWIGEGPRLPKVMDMHHAWPSLASCSKSALI